MLLRLDEPFWTYHIGSDGGVEPKGSVAWTTTDRAGDAGCKRTVPSWSLAFLGGTCPLSHIPQLCCPNGHETGGGRRTPRWLVLVGVFGAGLLSVSGRRVMQRDALVDFPKRYFD